MKRDPRAFLSDVIEAARAIRTAVDGISLDDYCKSRLIRSSVEREFTIIGEALTQLSRRDVDLFEQIDQAAQITSFRNKLTHEYVTINDQLVWGLIPCHRAEHLRIDCALADEPLGETHGRSRPDLRSGGAW